MNQVKAKPGVDKGTLREYRMCKEDQERELSLVKEFGNILSISPCVLSNPYFHRFKLFKIQIDVLTTS